MRSCIHGTFTYFVKYLYLLEECEKQYMYIEFLIKINEIA